MRPPEGTKIIVMLTPATLPAIDTHTHEKSKKRSMTYLVHNKTLFELYTAPSTVTHFPQFSSTSAAAPVWAVTVAEGGRQHPWAPPVRSLVLRCTETVERGLPDLQLAASALTKSAKSAKTC